MTSDRLQGAANRPSLWVRRLVAMVAVAVAIAFPAGYFGLSYLHLTAELTADAQISARLLTQFINVNPEIWPYKQHSLERILDQPSDHEALEPRRIYTSGGVLLLERSGDERWPAATSTGNLYDAGNPVGKVEIRRTLRPALWHTSLVALLGIGLGALVYWTLSLFPLRALDRALGALHDEKERAQVTLRSIGDGVITTDEQGRVVLINQAAEQLTGWSQQEAAGRPLSEVFRLLSEGARTPADDPAALVLRGGALVESSDHGVLVSRTGRECVVSNVGAPIRDAQDHLIGVVLVFRDVTEQRRAQQESLKVDKLESVGVLAGGIAHDFNNLLTAILNNIAIVQLHSGSGVVDVGETLQKAENAALRARHLTQQLLTFSKGGAPVRSVLSLPCLVEEATRFSLSGSGATCEFCFPEGLWAVEADEGQLTQVVSNLVVNADHATRSRGVIRVECGNITVAGQDGLPLVPGRYVTLAVVDDGMGIPRDHLTKIFDPYFSSKGTGSGLGLTTAFAVVKNHGGHIRVQSEVGSGSTFTVYLPASDRTPSAVAPVREVAARGQGTILLMDDEEDVREATGELLEFLGYRVDLAADGEGALHLYRAARDRGSRYAAVVMDLTIPGGMGGREAIQRLREIDPQVRAVVSSGYSNDPVMADCTKYGFDAVLSKPYRVVDLERVLAEVQGPSRG